MQYVDEFRDPALAKSLLAQINRQVEKLADRQGKPLQIMEVCGGHTHAIFKFGIDQLLPPQIEFIHGPGCPVCVLPMGRIDTSINIAMHEDVIFCTFGDVMRVPGEQGSLFDAKRKGADVRIVYSPLDALTLAKQNPTKKVVFFGIGFETTMPSSALTLQLAKQQNVTNFYFLCQHITIIPTLHSLLEQPDIRIDGFLAPGHVSMVVGATPYDFIAKDYDRPVVVTGFEPLDILQAILMLVNQFVDGRREVENQYRRIVLQDGNPQALAAMADVFETKVESEWRGLGVIPHSGVQLTEKYREFDAEIKFNTVDPSVSDDPQARCGDVLTGRCKPLDCPHFGTKCVPEHPIGALMVSSEGACAAYYKYHRDMKGGL